MMDLNAFATSKEGMGVLSQALLGAMISRNEEQKRIWALNDLLRELDREIADRKYGISQAYTERRKLRAELTKVTKHAEGHPMINKHNRRYNRKKRTV